VHARARGCVHVRAFGSVHVRVTLLIQHATLMRHIVSSFVAAGSTTFFDIILQNGMIFGKKLLNMKCVF
jgi:hypothetical protein